MHDPMVETPYGTLVGRRRTAGIEFEVRERFLTDAIYRVPAIRTAAGHAAAGGRAYVYQFARESPILDGQLGAAHALDEGFVWGVTDPKQVGMVEDTPETRRIACEMMAALFRFAASGAPGWRAYSHGEASTRVFGPEGAPMRDVDSAMLAACEGVERR